MRYDLKITGGTVVDGSGGPPARADVGVREGRIVEVGACVAPADREVDARGAIVAPGFVDLHCHYDGQATWDADLAPAVHHGVTTCVVGNCGVGFAPVRPADRARLVELMEGVEDIPGSVLSEGLPWTWESFAEYAAAVDALPHTLDIALQATHDPIRVHVMGDRAIAGEPATPADLEAMRALLAGALDAGAVGFSTGRTDNHRSARGAPTPASEATRAELLALAAAFHGRSRGVLQAVSDFDMEAGPDAFDGEFDLLEAMAAGAGGRPLSISLTQRDAAPGQWRRILARVEAAAARGVPVRVQVAPRAIGVMLGLDATFHPFVGYPSFKRLAGRPLADVVAAMRDPGFKARLLGERSEPIAGDGSPVPVLADRLLAQPELLAMRLFRLGENPDYEPPLDASLGAGARARGVPALDAIYDALLEDEGRELLYFPLFNYGGGNLDAVAEMLAHPLALLGLSDGGAHVGTVCDASFPTFLLTHWTRDRPRGRLPLERAVAMLTSRNADYLGLTDRGRVAEGLRADLVVFDLEKLGIERPRLARDLPAGGKRLLQGARGYRASVVAGHVVVEDGVLTGARPGRVVRATSSGAGGGA